MKKVEVKDRAYMKMAANFTRKQRKQWNNIRHEMWLLSDSLHHKIESSVNSTQLSREQMARLNDLVSQLPVLDEDGKGTTCFGNAIKLF